MYNYSINLIYRDLKDEKSDTQYRKELLDVFAMSEYTEEIIFKQDLLYKEVKEEYKEIIQLIKETDRLAFIRKFDEYDAFMLLFSWEYFYEHHMLIKAILTKPHNKNNVSLCKQNLFEKIKSNNEIKNNI